MSITQRQREPGTRSRMSAADRREVILDAARTAFADTGYHETSLDAVAERAGVSKALLYEHFSSKRELYVAMLEMHVHELVERISERRRRRASRESRGCGPASRPSSASSRSGAAPGGSCSATRATRTSLSGSTACATRSRQRSSS